MAARLSQDEIDAAVDEIYLAAAAKDHYGVGAPWNKENTAIEMQCDLCNAMKVIIVWPDLVPADRYSEAVRSGDALCDVRCTAVPPSAAAILATLQAGVRRAHDL